MNKYLAAGLMMAYALAVILLIEQDVKGSGAGYYGEAAMFLLLSGLGLFAAAIYPKKPT